MSLPGSRRRAVKIVPSSLGFPSLQLQSSAAQAPDASKPISIPGSMFQPGSSPGLAFNSQNGTESGKSRKPLQLSPLKGQSLALQPLMPGLDGGDTSVGGLSSYSARRRMNQQRVMYGDASFSPAPSPRNIQPPAFPPSPSHHSSAEASPQPPTAISSPRRRLLNGPFGSTAAAVHSTLPSNVPQPPAQPSHLGSRPRHRGHALSGDSVADSQSSEPTRLRTPAGSGSSFSLQTPQPSGSGFAAQPSTEPILNQRTRSNRQSMGNPINLNWPNVNPTAPTGPNRPFSGLPPRSRRLVGPSISDSAADSDSRPPAHPHFTSSHFHTRTRSFNNDSDGDGSSSLPPAHGRAPIPLHINSPSLGQPERDEDAISHRSRHRARFHARKNSDHELPVDSLSHLVHQERIGSGRKNDFSSVQTVKVPPPDSDKSSKFSRRNRNGNKLHGAIGETDQDLADLLSDDSGYDSEENRNAAAESSRTWPDPNAYLEIGLASDPNYRHRSSMEDAHVAKVALLKSNHLSGFFGIFDGHGGDQAAKYLEENLHKQFSKRLRKSPNEPLRVLEQTFLQVDSAMSRHSRFQDCGSTAVAAFVHTRGPGQRELIVANAGDAQCVLAMEGSLPAPVAPVKLGSPSKLHRHLDGTLDTKKLNTTSARASGSSSGSNSNNGSASNSASGSLLAKSLKGALRSYPFTAISMSFPHVASDRSEQARIRAAGGHVFMKRVNGCLAVTRSFGDNQLKSSGVTAAPHLAHHSLTQAHKFFILACDGLFDVLTGTEAVELVWGMKNAQEMAQKLVNTALQKGTTDNVSVMVVRLAD